MLNYAYNYAEINPSTTMCIGFFSTTSPETESDTLIAVSVNDPEYIGKYYNYSDGKFYYDQAYTQEFVSALL